MVIVYNPPSGAKISEKFRAEGISLAKPFEPNTTQYCEPAFAQALIATYPFLQIVTSEEIANLKKEVSKASDAVKEEPKVEEPEEEINPAIPVAEVVKTGIKEADKSTEIPDDLKGTDWYGDGVKETKDG